MSASVAGRVAEAKKKMLEAMDAWSSLLEDPVMDSRLRSTDHHFHMGKVMNNNVPRKTSDFQKRMRESIKRQREENPGPEKLRDLDLQERELDEMEVDPETEFAVQMRCLRNAFLDKAAQVNKPEINAEVDAVLVQLNRLFQKLETAAASTPDSEQKMNRITHRISLLSVEMREKFIQKLEKSIESESAEN